MGRKAELRLLSSPYMTEKGENSTIRFPRRVRGYFQFMNGQKVLIRKGGYELSLAAKKAYKSDVQRLATMLMEGRLTEQESLLIGFVSTVTQNKVNEHQGEVWISNESASITVGCDPEFGLIDPNTGWLVRADAVLPGSEKSKFGADGPGSEVRPDPSRDHRVVLGNIQRILEKPPAAAGKYRWIGGATYTDANRIYWFGGHVHLGRPSAIRAEEAPGIYKVIATVLDHLVALPMVAFDTPNPDKRRSGCPHHYGMAGDIRADYEEQDRFEYRVLSGLWLTHPALARIVLGVSKGITETAYGRILANSKDPEYILSPMNRKGLLKSFGLRAPREVQGAINRAMPTRLTPDALDTWEKQLAMLDNYDDYSEEIRAFVEIVRASPEVVVPQLKLDIKDNWQNRRPLIANATGALGKALEAVEEK